MGTEAGRDHPDCRTVDLLRSTLSLRCANTRTQGHTHTLSHTHTHAHKKRHLTNTHIFFTRTPVSLAGESTITLSVGHYALFPQ